MPVSHSFRSRHNSPPSTIATPARTGHRRSLSSNPGTITSSGHQQKLNVVTRVAIEGKARRGQDGASIRMFLKVRVSCRCWQLIFILPFFTLDNSSLRLCYARLDYSSLFRFEWLLSVYSTFFQCFTLQRKMSRSSRPRSTH